MTKKSILAGLLLGSATAFLLAAGTDAATAVAETETASAVSETLENIVNFLPFPWNVIGGAVLTAAGAIFAWRKSKKKTD